MTPLEKLLRAEARRLGVGVEVLLKDYAIGHVLGAIAAEPELANTLVFKGGTALKKLYFGDYRFSEDLDFTAAGFPDLLGRKCAVRAVAFDSPADFFPEALVDATRETWVRSLGALVPELPPFDAVLGALVPRVMALLER